MTDLYRGSTTIDFDFDMKIHPVTKDLVLKRNEEAIVQSVKNLVRTRYGEVLFNSELDGGIGDQLFDTMNSVVVFKIKSGIEKVIKQWEPRVEMKQIEVFRTPDLNGIIVKMSFYFANNPVPYETTFNLQRMR